MTIRKCESCAYQSARAGDATLWRHRTSKHGDRRGNRTLDEAIAEGFIVYDEAEMDGQVEIDPRLTQSWGLEFDANLASLASEARRRYENCPTDALYDAYCDATNRMYDERDKRAKAK